ncbi:MAG: TetR/AcrR family transcriptional regulator [Flavobacteriaceae bacterium]
MKSLLSNFKIQVNANTYVKDPETSDLGKRIIENSILLIDEIGFESFTFKKLGIKINSNESSVYRYFDNKHKLLLYLTSWYWNWLEYQLVFSTLNVQDSNDKLRRAIEIITKPIQLDTNYSHINEVLLNKIIINEFSKSYLTKEVDQENKEGYFEVYKRLIMRLKKMISECQNSYPFPSSLASTIIEGSLYQHFLKDHFISITDCSSDEDLTAFFIDMVFNTIKNSNND